MNLKTVLKFLFCLVVSMLFVSCGGYRNFVRNLGSELGAIQIRDIVEADFVRTELPEFLGLNSTVISVNPTSKITLVRINKIDSKSQREEIKNKLYDFLLYTKTQIKPLKVEFSLTKNLSEEKIIIDWTACRINQLAKAPQGFTWRYFKTIRGFFLVPEGWHVEENGKFNKNMILISIDKNKKSSSEKIRFLSIIVPNSSKKSLEDGYDLAKGFFENFEKQGKKVLNLEKTGDGKYLVGYRADVTFKDEMNAIIIKPTCVMVNIKSGTLYTCFIESPLEKWKDEGKTLTTIMTNFGFEPEY